MKSGWICMLNVVNLVFINMGLVMLFILGRLINVMQTDYSMGRLWRSTMTVKYFVVPLEDSMTAMLWLS